MGPNKNPIPVAISMSPMFYSLSDGFELETTIAIEATAFMPDPSPPISWAMKEATRNAVAFSKLDNQ